MNNTEIFEEIKILFNIYKKLSAPLLQRKFMISFEKAEHYMQLFANLDINDNR